MARCSASFVSHSASPFWRLPPRTASVCVLIRPASVRRCLHVLLSLRVCFRVQSIPFTFTNQYQDTVVVTAFMQASLSSCRLVLCLCLRRVWGPPPSPPVAARHIVACPPGWTAALCVSLRALLCCRFGPSMRCSSLSAVACARSRLGCFTRLVSAVSAAARRRQPVLPRARLRLRRPAGVFGHQLWGKPHCASPVPLRSPSPLSVM